jgi:hypothetical protein
MKNPSLPIDQNSPICFAFTFRLKVEELNSLFWQLIKNPSDFNWYCNLPAIYHTNTKHIKHSNRCLRSKISGSWQMASDRVDPTRHIKAPHGSERTCKSWQTEAALRMLMNNLDEEASTNCWSYFLTQGCREARVSSCLWRHWACCTKLGLLRQDCGGASPLTAHDRFFAVWRTMRRCSCSRASPSASFARTRMLRAYSSQTPIWCQGGRRGSTSTSSTARGS